MTEDHIEDTDVAAPEEATVEDDDGAEDGDEATEAVEPTPEGIPSPSYGILNSGPTPEQIEALRATAAAQEAGTEPEAGGES